MTENDYIAEYVKERRKDILGFDFVVWKTQKVFSEMIKDLSKTIARVDWKEEDLNKLINDMKNEKKEAQREKLEAEERGY